MEVFFDFINPNVSMTSANAWRVMGDNILQWSVGVSNDVRVINWDREKDICITATQCDENSKFLVKQRLFSEGQWTKRLIISISLGAGFKMLRFIVALQRAVMIRRRDV